MVDGVSISWVSGHRRSAEIAEVAGVRPHFIKDRSGFLPLRYLKQILATRALLRAEKPQVIVVMQPPPLALAAVLPYARKSGALLIGDLHSGTFMDRKWAWTSRWVLKTLRRHGGAFVPNADLAALCRTAGVKVFVSHGWIKPLTDQGQPLPAGVDSETDFVLVPFTYSDDEPVDAVLEAAALTPDLFWVLTGRAPTAVRNAAPSNVIFSGYVSDAEFQALRLNARAILALTTRPSTMQSAGYEAVASATPLITVDEPVLVDYFGDAAIYTALSAPELANAAVASVRDFDAWQHRMAARRDLIMTAQPEVSASIQRWILEYVSHDSGDHVGVR